MKKKIGIVVLLGCLIACSGCNISNKKEDGLYRINGKVITEYGKKIKKDVANIYAQNSRENEAREDLCEMMTYACSRKYIGASSYYKGYGNNTPYVSSVMYSKAEWGDGLLDSVCVEVTIRDTGEKVYNEFRINKDGLIEEFDIFSMGGEERSNVE